MVRCSLHYHNISNRFISFYYSFKNLYCGQIRGKNYNYYYLYYFTFVICNFLILLAINYVTYINIQNQKIPQTRFLMCLIIWVTQKNSISLQSPFSISQGLKILQQSGWRVTTYVWWARNWECSTCTRYCFSLQLLQLSAQLAFVSLQLFNLATMAQK